MVRLKVGPLAVSLELTLGSASDDDVTVDLVGTHHDIPPASYGAGFVVPDREW